MDTTVEAGIEQFGKSWGASVGDINGDGCLDIWLSNHNAGVSHLYQNSCLGTFNIVWADPESRDSHTAAFADFDNDNDQDIAVSVGAAGGKSTGENLFLVNDNGVLTNRAALFELTDDFGRGRAPLFMDWNNDGWLDVFLTNLNRKDGLGKSAVYLNNGGAFQKTLEVPGDGEFSVQSDLQNNGTSYLIPHNHTSFPYSVYKVGDDSLTNERESLFESGVFGVKDFVVEDLDGDLIPDIYMTRMDIGVSEFSHDSEQAVAAISVNKNARTLVVETSGSLDLTVLPSYVSRLIAVGGSGQPPTDSQLSIDMIPVGGAGETTPGAQLSLDVDNLNNHGMPAFSPGIDDGIYIGFEPGRGWLVSVSSPAKRWISFIASSTSPITAVELDDEKELGLPDQIFSRKGDRFSTDNNLSLPEGNSSCVSVASGDFDNDMDIDLYLVCHSLIGNRPNILLLNDGVGNFDEVVLAGGAQGSTIGRGDSAAVFDYDNDGFLDLLVTNGHGSYPFAPGPSQLFRNQGVTKYNWLAASLTGIQSNNDGYGAKLIAVTDGRKQLREHNASVHGMSQNSKRVHYGLADNDTVDVLRIEWPSGIVQSLTNVAANQFLSVSEDVSPDADADELTDSEERYFTSSSMLADSDGDGLNDAIEVYRTLTSPVFPDTDADGVEDGAELELGRSPTTFDQSELPISCGWPQDRSADRAIYIWQSCSNSRWFVRTKNSVGRLEFNGEILFENPDTVTLRPTSLEPDDVLELVADQSKATFNLTVFNTYVDGFSFGFSGGACFKPAVDESLPILVGPSSIPLTSSLDLVELTECHGADDSDKDGLPDNQELLQNTDPLTPDTDGGGLRDGHEVNLGLNPLDPEDDFVEALNYCGRPTITPETATWIWLDCDGSRQIHILVAGDGSKGRKDFRGTLTSEGEITLAAMLGLESNDELSNIATGEISYALKVWGKGVDEFVVTADKPVCFTSLDEGAHSIYVGRHSVPLPGDQLSLFATGSCNEL